MRTVAYFSLPLDDPYLDDCVEQVTSHTLDEGDILDQQHDLLTDKLLADLLERLPDVADVEAGRLRHGNVEILVEESHRFVLHRSASDEPAEEFSSGCGSVSDVVVVDDVEGQFVSGELQRHVGFVSVATVKRVLGPALDERPRTEQVVLEEGVGEEQAQAVLTHQGLAVGVVGFGCPECLGQFCEDLVLHLVGRDAGTQARDAAPDLIEFGIVLVDQKRLYDVLEAGLGLLQIDDLPARSS